MTRYYVDCEFIDDGKAIDLISIGIVGEYGREYYAQSCEFNPDNASKWVQKHVFTALAVCPYINLTNAYYIKAEIIKHSGIGGKCTSELNTATMRNTDYLTEQIKLGNYPDCGWRTRKQIKQELIAFLDPEKYGKPELFGWCSAYDFVAFCQLFGTMMDLPKEYPHYIKDLQQVLDERGIVDSDLPQQEDGLHNALADARHIKRLWEEVLA